ncbi:MAG: hypothetical protein L0Z73_05030 [Gammaproteobacteria bacterium]|nr:hypothetical protein [Gammaproteobacteria bacterium]
MMRTRLIQMAAIMSMTVLSSAVFAEGAGCKSKDGHAKHDMSAETMQEFKNNHSWIFSDGAEADSNTKSQEQTEKSGGSSAVKTDKLVEI